MKKKYITVILLFLLWFCGAQSVKAKTLPSISLQGSDENETETKAKTKTETKKGKIPEVYIRVGIVAGGALAAGVLALIIVIVVLKKKDAKLETYARADNGGKKRICRPDDAASDMWKDTIRLTDINDPGIVYNITFDSTKEIGKAVVGSGRVKQVDVKISDDNGVSDAHCVFYKKGRMFYVKDLNSTNGTKINGNKIYEETSILSGDTIKIGRRIYQIVIRCPLSEKPF